MGKRPLHKTIKVIDQVFQIDDPLLEVAVANV